MKSAQLVIYLIFVIKCESARILAVFPIPSYSHQVAFRQYTEELAKRGHKVTVITTHPAFPKDKRPKNLTEIDLHGPGQEFRTKLFQKLITAKDIIKQQEVSLHGIGQMFEIYQKSGLLDEFTNNKTHTFDLVIVEASVRSALVYSYVYNAPVIQISSFGGNLGTFEAVGASTHPLVYPSALRQRFQDLTIWKKILEYISHYWVMWIYYNAEYEENMVLKKYFGPDTPDLAKLEKNIAMVFLNVHPVWDANRPVPPNIVYVGELNQNPRKELPTKWMSYLNSSKNGVILVSFGTNLNHGILTAEKIQTMVKVFSELSYDILIQNYNITTIKTSKNILKFNWIPQVDILKHPKVKLFITQGGLQSSLEAIDGEVPLIGIPMMWDQWLNVDKYVQFKIGVQLDINTLNEEDLKTAIKTVIGHKSYKKNIIKLRTLMYDQPQKPLDKAVWWTEYVLKYGGVHLRTPAADLTWSEYYEIDIIISIILAISLTVGTAIVFLRKFIELI